MRLAGQYLDDNLGQQGSLQRNPAAVSAAIQVVNQRVMPAAKAFTHGGSADKMHAAFRELEGMIQSKLFTLTCIWCGNLLTDKWSPTGPFITGQDFSLADISAFPMVQRLMEDSRRVGLDKAQYPNICSWFEACRARESVAKTRSSWWWW